MVKTEKASLEHFEAVYKLFLNFNYRRNAKSDWRRLFANHFHSEESHFGYVLLDNDKVVGFLGLIFARRKINNCDIKFCNIGNWIVAPEFRNKSIILLMPVLKLKDYVLTNFTASETVATILKTLKFKVLDDKFVTILPVPNLSSLKLLNKKMRIYYDDQIKNYLNHDDLRIFNDHSNPDFNCKHILFKDPSGVCYIVAKRAYIRKIPYLRIHYISNVEIFAKYIDALRIIVPFKFKVAVIIVDKTFLKGKEVKYVINYKWPRPRLYKSNHKDAVCDLKNIDNLYSEFMLLNI